MFTNILGTVEFCIYHLCIVAASRVSRIPIRNNKRHDEFTRRYLASMQEIRILKAELAKVMGKRTTRSLRLRCAQALAYIFTRGDKIYHDSYMSTSLSTARNWAYKFRHPFRARKIKMNSRSKVTDDIVEKIITMKKCSGNWGGKRISDELKKMGIRISATTVTKVLKENGFDNPTDDKKSKWEKWEGEFKDHMWACDFFFVKTMKEISCMVFILIDIHTKEVLALDVHEGRKGIDSFWVAGKITQVITKQKRQPKNLIHDRDPLFEEQVKRLCSVSDIKELRIPPQYPVMNCYCERAIKSVKYELTHHFRAKNGDELQSILKLYKLWFNKYRPHQGIDGHIPQDFSEGKEHPEPIPIEQLKKKKMRKLAFANGLLNAFYLVDDIKKVA